MNCGYKEKIILYYYGEASAELKAGVESHLNNCPACRGELAALSAADTWLKTELNGPSTAVVAAVLKQAVAVRHAGWFAFSAWPEGLLAGALAAVMALGFSLPAPGTSPGLAWNSGLDSGLDLVEYSLYQAQAETDVSQTDWEYTYGLLEAESRQALG